LVVASGFGIIIRGVGIISPVWTLPSCSSIGRPFRQYFPFDVGWFPDIMPLETIFDI
jgi:hypothetical protein